MFYDWSPNLTGRKKKKNPKNYKGVQTTEQLHSSQFLQSWLDGLLSLPTTIFNSSCKSSTCIEDGTNERTTILSNSPQRMATKDLNT